MVLQWFKTRKKPIVVDTPQEILDTKRELQTASNAVVENSQKIKQVLITDHVTLRIQVATQGGKHA